MFHDLIREDERECRLNVIEKKKWSIDYNLAIKKIILVLVSFI
jgi:hypothetical protein